MEESKKLEAQNCHKVNLDSSPTAKEVIVEILKATNKNVKKSTGKLLYYKEDIEEIKHIWNEDICTKIVKYMKKLKSDQYTDYTICPWCCDYEFSQPECMNSYNIEENFCIHCTYGKRHKKCAEENGTYNKVTSSLDKAIIDLPKLKESIQKILKKYD